MFAFSVVCNVSSYFSIQCTIINLAPYFCTSIPLGISETIFPMKNDDRINPCSSCDQSYRTSLELSASAIYNSKLIKYCSYIQCNSLFTRTEFTAVSFCGLKYLMGQISSTFELFELFWSPAFGM